MKARYCKKPVVIEAERFYRDGDAGVFLLFHPGDLALCDKCGKKMRWHGQINTLEGVMRVCPGDWIITGVKGERYPCKPDIFEITYESVPATWTPPDESAMPFG